jgi:hypothetical protein
MIRACFQNQTGISCNTQSGLLSFERWVDYRSYVRHALTLIILRAVICAFVLVFSSEICPSIADENGEPFGIKAREQHVSVASVAATRSWQLHFLSVNDFVARVRPDDFTTVSSGENDDIYYAAFRRSPNILVIAYACKSEPKSNGSMEVLGEGPVKGLIDQIPWKPVYLLNTNVETKAVQPPQLTEAQGYSFIGLAGQVPLSYSGPLTITVQLWNENKDKLRRKASTTIKWIPAT